MLVKIPVEMGKFTRIAITSLNMLLLRQVFLYTIEKSNF